MWCYQVVHLMCECPTGLEIFTTKNQLIFIVVCSFSLPFSIVVFNNVRRNVLSPNTEE